MYPCYNDNNREGNKVRGKVRSDLADAAKQVRKQ